MMQKMTSNILGKTNFEHIASGADGDIKLNIMWTFEGQRLQEKSPKCVDRRLHNVELYNENEILNEEQRKSVIDYIVTRLKWEKFAREELAKRFEFRELSFEPFYIERNNDLPLKFVGAILGSVYETPLNFLKVTLYRTKEGQFVCERNFDNSDSNKRDHTAEICSTVSEIYNFIGDHELAKQLIQEANVDFSIVVK
jgi:hypothetical protein